MRSNRCQNWKLASLMETNAVLVGWRPSLAAALHGGREFQRGRTELGLRGRERKSLESAGGREGGCSDSGAFCRHLIWTCPWIPGPTLGVPATWGLVASEPWRNPFNRINKDFPSLFLYFEWLFFEFYWLSSSFFSVLRNRIFRLPRNVSYVKSSSECCVSSVSIHRSCFSVRPTWTNSSPTSAPRGVWPLRRLLIVSTNGRMCV